MAAVVAVRTHVPVALVAVVVAALVAVMEPVASDRANLLHVFRIFELSLADKDTRKAKPPVQISGFCFVKCVALFHRPEVGSMRNEAPSCPGIFPRTLHFYYVASSPGSPLPHLLDGHRGIVGSNGIPASS